MWCAFSVETCKKGHIFLGLCDGDGLINHRTLATRSIREMNLDAVASGRELNTCYILKLDRRERTCTIDTNINRECLRGVKVPAINAVDNRYCCLS